LYLSANHKSFSLDKQLHATILTGRIRQLAERYDTSLTQLVEEVDALAAKVDGHLRTMGV